jgi:hypothetical protein
MRQPRVRNEEHLMPTLFAALAFHYCCLPLRDQRFKVLAESVI